MLSEFLQDALFAAIAAIGFAAISNPPRRAYLYCAVIAAVGHSSRFLMMNESILGLHIVLATTIAAFIVGIMAVLLSPVAKTPAETCLFPSLLPMIPGMYAYRSFWGPCHVSLSGPRGWFQPLVLSFRKQWPHLSFHPARHGNRSHYPDFSSQENIISGHPLTAGCSLIFITDSFTP